MFCFCYFFFFFFCEFETIKQFVRNFSHFLFYPPVFFEEEHTFEVNMDRLEFNRLLITLFVTIISGIWCVKMDGTWVGIEYDGASSYSCINGKNVDMYVYIHNDSSNGLWADASSCTCMYYFFDNIGSYRYYYLCSQDYTQNIDVTIAKFEGVDLDQPAGIVIQSCVVEEINPAILILIQNIDITIKSGISTVVVASEEDNDGVNPNSDNYTKLCIESMITVENVEFEKGFGCQIEYNSDLTELYTIALLGKHN